MTLFRPRALPTIGVALGSVVFGSLGTWQVRRMGEAEQARAEWVARLAEPPFDVASPPADPDTRRARVTGVPAWDDYTLLTNKVMDSLPGYDLVVPVRHDAGTVLVDVGWVPADDWEAVIAAERAVEGPRTFEGLARVHDEDPSAGDGFPAPGDGTRRYWRRPSPRAMGGPNVAPFLLYDGDAVPEGKRSKDRDPPIAGWTAMPHERPHLEYALTWFGILAALFGFWVHGSLVPRPPVERSSGDDDGAAGR